MAVDNSMTTTSYIVAVTLAAEPRNRDCRLHSYGPSEVASNASFRPYRECAAVPPISTVAAT
jgi:hypothetical protein